MALGHGSEKQKHEMREDHFNQNLIGIGWSEVGDLSNVKSRARVNRLAEKRVRVVAILL